MEMIMTALLGLGFPGIVIALLVTALGFSVKELLACKKDQIQTVKDLNELRLTDLKDLIGDYNSLSKDQIAAFNRLADKIK